MPRYTLVFLVSGLVIMSLLSCAITEPANATSKVDPPLELEETEEEVVIPTETKTETVTHADEKLNRFVDEWLGVKYKYGGTTNEGIDCSGFANNLYQEVYGLEVERTAGSIYASTDKVLRAQLQAGDFVFFRINGKTISHVGVYLADDEFVHASTSLGVIISNLDEAYYKKYFVSGGRIR